MKQNEYSQGSILANVRSQNGFWYEEIRVLEIVSQEVTLVSMENPHVIARSPKLDQDRQI